MNKFSYNRINKDPLAQAVLKILVGEDATETKSPADDGQTKTITVRKGKTAPVKSAAKDMEDETGSQRKLAADMDDQVSVTKEAKEDLKDHPKYKLLTKKTFGKMKHWDPTDKPTDTKEEVVNEIKTPQVKALSGMTPLGVKSPDYLNSASNSGSSNKTSKSPNFLNKNKSGQSPAPKPLTKEEEDRIEAKIPQLSEMVTRKHFQDVANTVRAIEDPSKRQEFANHHASIFASQNPRFDHARFHAACGTRHD